MFSKFFIEHPVLSSVIALVLLLLGAIAVNTLPVSQYPPITPPTVQVTTRYPGANAKTLVETVALPIEQQVNGIENMLYMQSTSTNDGNYTLTVTFRVGTDLNFAQVLVQNCVASALASLPPAVQAQGVVTKKKSTAILQIVTLTSKDPQYDALFLSNYATIKLHDELARLPGVGDVNVLGTGQYSMRIWLDPQQLRIRKLTPADVLSALRAQNQQVAAGQIGMPPTPAHQDFQLTVNIAGALKDTSEFESIIVKSAPQDQSNGGGVTRIRDIGRVELGAQTYGESLTMDGKSSAGILIYQLPGANALNVAALVQAKMKQLAKDFPGGVEYSVPFDTTVFVKASVHEVYVTLFEAGVLVLVVIFLFLQSVRATLVPAVTVPVTIVGTFAAMAALGFSINLLTLFAIVLAIGIVVDDAIVVVEGATQQLERGASPKQAAILAMRELLGPIIGITLVLMSVFLPAALMPGVTGQMYRQFALVIAATALISAICATTLSPTQCALWLRPHARKQRKNWLFRGFDSLYYPLENRYAALIERMVSHSHWMLILAAVLVVFAACGFARIPAAFIPIEDQGYLIIAAQLPDAAAFDRTTRAMDELSKTALATPGVNHTIAIGGISLLDNSASLANAGAVYVVLKDWSKRGKGQDLRGIYKDLSARIAHLQDVRSYVVIPPPIQGLGNSGGFTMQIEDTSGSFDYAALQRVTDAVISHANTQSSLQRITTSYRANVPQITADIDRDKAESLNVPVGDVYATLQSYLGSTYANQLTLYGRTFQVYAQADANFRLNPEDIGQFYVRNRDGLMIPIGTLADVHRSVGPAIISLYNLYPSAAVNGAPAADFSSGQALEVMEQVAQKTLPSGFKFEWTAMSYQEKLVGSSALVIFALALVLVYFVLAAQYGSWIIPGAVLFAVPLALLGTVGALLALGLANNLYTQIGLVLLIALSAKNAILIVEVARELRESGKSIVEAAVLAARARFRPILMTSFAFILGVVPLVTATGAGANSRRSIGITVFSGMLASTCLAVLFVPSFFVVLQRLRERNQKETVAEVPETSANVSVARVP